MHFAARRCFHAGLFSSAALVALASACSLTTSFEGLSSGGGPFTPDSSASDGPGSPDAGSDAAADAGSDGDARPVDPCAGALFCDRFERDEVGGSEWGQPVLAAGGLLAIDPTLAASGTRSLLMTVPPGTAPRAWMSFGTTTTNHRHGRVDWSMMSDAQPDRELQVMRIQLESNVRASFVFVSLVPGSNMVLAEQRDETGVNSSSTYSNIVLDRAFTPGKWQRWSMELDATTSPPTAKVSVDGVVIGKKNLANPFDTGVLKILLGATYVRDGASRKTWFDDVALLAL